MYAVNRLVCISCFNRFDDARKPCLGSCTHTMCLVCKKKQRIRHCPICKRTDAFKEEQINYSALEAMKEIEENVELNIVKVDEQIASDGQCFECNEYTKRLRLCIDCSESRGDIRKVGSDYIMVAGRNEVPLEFLKLKSMCTCSSCTIEGAHAGHRTVLIEKALRANFQVKGSPTELLQSRYQRMYMEFEGPKKNGTLSPSTTYHPRTARARREFAQLRRVQQRLRKEKKERERWSEMANLMMLESFDLMRLDVKDPVKEAGIEEVRSLIKGRFTHLTTQDVSRFNEKIRKRMEELGSEEQLKKATEQGLEAYWMRKREFDAAREKYRRAMARLGVWQVTPSRMLRKCSDDYFRTIRRMQEAELAMTRANWQSALNSLTGFTTGYIHKKLRILRPFFGVVPKDS